MQDIPIIYEHPDFLVIDKPINRSFHKNDNEEGVFNSLKSQTGLPLWPVHRLDKITTGLLIFAKSQVAASQFGQLFEKQMISKIYVAISDKKPKKKQGHIIGDMEKSRSGSWKLKHSKLNPAKTYFVSKSLLPNIRLFWIKPSTGKTHQIRVALKSIGSPILGDTRYSGAKSDRAYLHAYQLSFNWHEEAINIKTSKFSGEYFEEAKQKGLLCNSPF
jgi:tRNA pseudouridine32 synthase/23S rRNA pseudouridine746 synthase